MSLLVITNPSAGSAPNAERIAELLGDLPEADVRVTRHEGHARELAGEAAAEGYTMVVAAGGDGTLNEVVNGLMESHPRPPLGLLPLGTANDFARSLSLSSPPTELEAWTWRLRAPKLAPCDVVAFHDEDGVRYFINFSASGFSGQLNENLRPEIKEYWGPLAYLRAAAETLPELTPYDLTLTFDDDETVETRALNLAVANGRFVAGGIPVAPLAHHDDGLFDVIVVKECSLTALAPLAARMMVGSHLECECEDECILFRRAQRLEVVSDPPMPINVDGELLGELEGRFEMHEGALQVLVPSS